MRPPQIPHELKEERTWSSTLLAVDRPPVHSFALKRDRQTDISGQQSNNEGQFTRGGDSITVLPDSLASPARPSRRSSVTIKLYKEDVRMVRDVVRYNGCEKFMSR